MTGEEKRKKMKEEMKAAYKRDLQKRKEFLESAKRMKHSKKMNDAITNLTAGLEDDSDDWIEKLNRESALSEAKLDMSLDAAANTAKELDKLAKQAEAEKFSAAELLKQMKREMGLLDEDEETTEETTNAEETAAEGTEGQDKKTKEAKKKTPPPPKSLGDW